MGIRLDTACRNALADAVETTIGTSPSLELRTGARPTNLTDADSGTLLAAIPVPADWLTTAAAGVKTKQGVWSTTAVAVGNQGHFRLKSSGGTVRADGSITLAGGGGDMIANALGLVVDQYVSVSSFTVTAGNVA